MTLSSLAVGSFELEPAFDKNIHEYTVNCGEPQQGTNPVVVTFEPSEPDTVCTASYSYDGGGGAVPIYLWDNPPYVFDAWDCPGRIGITVQHGAMESHYLIHTVNSFTHDTP